MQAIGVGMLVVGAAGLLLRSVHVFRKSWPKLDQVVFAAFLRVRGGLVLLWLWQSSAVISGCAVLGLKVLGAAPDWLTVLAWWFWGAALVFGAEWLYQAVQARLEERRFEAFRRHRKSIRQDLAVARTLLPAGGEGAHLARFDRWLIAGELESAFDELVAAGEGRACPPEFWRALGEAARKLGLEEEAEGIRGRLGPSADVGLPQHGA